MSTTANVRRFDSSRFYTPAGEAVYEIAKKRGDGMKKPTIADARANGWLPSVTTILKILNKPALQDWLIEQAVLAVLTSPRVPGESTDAFVNRILKVERVQDQEASGAADRGTSIHAAIEAAIQGEKIEDEFLPYIAVVLPLISALGKCIWSEKVLVGDSYAGRGDYAAETDRHIVVLDFKTTKKVPKEAYPEHEMQVAAYCKTLGNTADKHVIGGLLYISSVNPLENNLCLMEDWERHYTDGFLPVLKVWQYLNSYVPGVSH